MSNTKITLPTRKNWSEELLQTMRLSLSDCVQSMREKCTKVSNDRSQNAKTMEIQETLESKGYLQIIVDIITISDIQML